MADLGEWLAKITLQRDALIDSYADAMTVSPGKSAGDDATTIWADMRLPSKQTGLPDSPFDDEGTEKGDWERWRLRTSSKATPLKIPKQVVRDRPREAYHGAAAEKGRRVLMTDLNRGEVAAFLAWHFEAGPIGPGKSKSKRRRPHLVVSAGVRDEAEGQLRSEYTVMLWHLFQFVAAIDQETVERNRVGVYLDGRVLLTEDEFRAFGMSKGPAERNGGYQGTNYYELSR